MHVLLPLAATDAGRSGLSTYVRELYRAMLARDLVHRVTLLGTREDLDTCGLPLSDPRVGTQVVPDTFAGRGPSVLLHLGGLPRLANTVGADVVHLPVGNRRPGTAGGVPVVTTVHDLADQDGGRDYGVARALFARRVVPKALRLAQRIIVISHSTRIALARHAPNVSDRVVVIPNGVDLDRFHPGDVSEARRVVEERLGIAAPYILYPARLEHPAKNHLTLIEAFRRARRRLSLPHRLVLIGAKWPGADRILAEVSRSAGDVVYPGFVADDLLPQVVRGADLVVFPSLHEGFGLPPLEAMASGVPLLASDASSLPEVVGDGGALVDCRRVEPLESAIGRLLADEDERRRLTRSGLRRAAKFGWGTCAKRTARVLREVM